VLFLYCRQYLKCKLPINIPQQCVTLEEFDFSDCLVTAPFVYSTFQAEMISMSERSNLRLVAEIAALGHFLAFAFVMPPSVIIIRLKIVLLFLQCILVHFCITVAFGKYQAQRSAGMLDILNETFLGVLCSVLGNIKFVSSFSFQVFPSHSTQ